MNQLYNLINTKNFKLVKDFFINIIMKYDISINKPLKTIKSEKRKDYISWEQYFMGLALLAAKRSKDPKTQVGCCIVDNNNIIKSIGYNGFPRGCNDDILCWGNDKNSYDNKYRYVIHAEVNAIILANTNLQNTIAYITHFPCAECAKWLIQSGIRKIVYLNYKSDITSHKLFLFSKIEYIKYKLSNRTITITI